jgi:phage tail sheath gpL-like
MTINDSSLAAGVGVSANNTPFTSAALNVTRKVLVCAQVLPANEGNFTENVPEIVTNVAYHANKAGRGTAAAKMLEWVREVYDGELWLAPQFEDAFTQSAGDITFAGTCTAAGTLHLYIGGHKIPNINIEIGDDGETVQEKVVTAVAANPDLPVTAVEDGVTAEQVDFTAKSGGVFGDFSIQTNLGFNEELPAGITIASTTQMTGGAGVPTLQDVLDELGIDDDQNENFFTALVHVNGQDSTTLNALSTWNGVGNTISGNWGKLVHRPLRSIVGDIAAGSAGLTALLTLGGGRKETDRTSGCVAVPDSPNSADEIAAKTIGIMEQIAAVRPEENYVGQVLPGVWPGDVADRWTSSYTNRDTATKTGITATTVKGGEVKLSNVITFYHSVAIPVTSNGYREMRNISVLQNLLDNIATEFESVTWQGFTIVEDKSEVSNAVNREKVRDLENVRSTLNGLADLFYQKAWLYNSSFTKDKLKEGGYISIRTSSDGFNMVFPCLLSGVGNIIDFQLAFDINLAAA